MALASSRHKRAARALFYAMIIDTPEAWESAAHLLALRLTVGERAALLAVALHSLQPDQAAVICDLAFDGVAA